MNNINDMRLNKETFKDMIGHKFIKYRCDPFTFTNTVTAVVGIYIDNKVYKIFNEQELIDYFDIKDDFAVWNVYETKDSDIQSYIANCKQIDTPINEIIKNITLVNEHQTAIIDSVKYELWVTRSIIFHLENKDIYFEKSDTAFSEEIEIRRGHDLLKEYPKRNSYFMDGWAEDVIASVETEFITV